MTVTDNVGTDGVDTLRNVERLQFADVTINSGAGTQGTTVPNVLNQLQATATTNLANVGLGVSVTTANSATIAVGRVISQSSAGGSQVTAGSVIGLVISLGPTTVLVPNVVGTTQAGATSALAGVGLLTTTTSASSDTVAAGNVISQVPAAGQSAIVGSAVGLVISNGPSTLGLVAAFGFEETVGTAIIDSSANPMNGTIANANGTGTAPTRVANGGKIGRALRFDGGDNVSVVDGVALTKLDLTNGMTLEAWVNPSTMNGWESVIYKERGGAGTGLLSYALYAQDGDPSLPPAGYVRTSAGGPDRGIQALTQLPLNVWSHIAVTYTTGAGPASSTLNFYVNGALVQTITNAINQNLLPSTQPLRIGNSNASISEGFNGMIDEVRVYNRALTAAEITIDMTKPVVFGTPVGAVTRRRGWAGHFRCPARTPLFNAAHHSRPGCRASQCNPPASENRNAVHTGTAVGPYQIVRQIGAGSMGVVWLADDPRLRRKVALKTVKAAAADTAEGRLRLIGEARAAAALNHPNIAAVHDVLDIDGQVIVVFEYVEGDTLAARLQRGPMPVTAAIEISWQLADALAAAHAQGVIHRDLNPSNVVIGPDGRVKVLDFGIARVLPAEADGSAGAPGHGRRRAGRHAGLCGAGAAPVAQRGRPRRPVRAGRDHVRDDHGQPAIRRQRRGAAGGVDVARRRAADFGIERVGAAATRSARGAAAPA